MPAKSEIPCLSDLESIAGAFNSPIRGTFYDMTPEELIVPITGSLEVTLKPNSDFEDGKKIVIIVLKSYLFEILNPTGRDGVITQIYGFFTKNDVIKFRIALRKEKEPKVNVSYAIKESCPFGKLLLWTGGIKNQELKEEVQPIQNSKKHLLPEEVGWSDLPVYKYECHPRLNTSNDDIEHRKKKFKEVCMKINEGDFDPKLVPQNFYLSKKDTKKAENPTLKSTKTDKSMAESTKTLKSSKRSEKTAATTEIQSKSEYGIEGEEKQEEESKEVEKPKKKNPCCVII